MSNNFKIPTKSLLYFDINKDTFALDTALVIETHICSKVTKVPYSTDIIDGVANFRGEVLPIINIEKILYHIPINTKQKNVIVIDVKNESLNQKIGFYVDKVKGVLNIPISDIKPVPKMNSHFNEDCFSGIFHINSESVLTINPEYIFSTQSLTFKNDMI